MTSKEAVGVKSGGFGLHRLIKWQHRFPRWSERGVEREVKGKRRGAWRRAWPHGDRGEGTGRPWEQDGRRAHKVPGARIARERRTE